jgi:hypothetical protein
MSCFDVGWKTVCQRFGVLVRSMLLKLGGSSCAQESLEACFACDVFCSLVGLQLGFTAFSCSFLCISVSLLLSLGTLE